MNAPATDLNEIPCATLTQKHMIVITTSTKSGAAADKKTGPRYGPVKLVQL